MAAPADPVAAHVAELARVLRGPAAARRSMLAETRDGLDDATAAYIRSGHAPRAAAALAVRDFGDVRCIAPGYQAELVARQGRRSALLLAVLFPGLVLGWDLLWSSGVVGWNGPTSPYLLTLARVQDVTSVVITVLAVGLLLATFRRSVAPHLVTAAVGVIGAIGALLCGGTAILMNTIDVTATVHQAQTRPAVLAALIVSAAALVLLCRSSVRTLRTALARPS